MEGHHQEDKELDSMGGGAWPFLVGSVTCLIMIKSVNEQDLT